MAMTPDEMEDRERSYSNLSDSNPSTGIYNRPKGVDRSNSHPIIRSGTWRGENSYSQLSDSNPTPGNRPMDRSNSQPVTSSGTWRGRVASVTANFFGVGDNCEEDQLRWRTRKSRHLSRRHGGLKPEYEATMTEREREEISLNHIPNLPMPHIVDPLARPGGAARTLPRDETDSSAAAARQPLASQLSSGTVTSSIYQKQLSHRMIRQRSKRQSVARMGWDAVKSLKRPVSKPSLSHGCLVQQRPPLIHSRSFAPASLQVDEDEPDAVSLDPSQFFSTKDGDSHQFFSPSVGPVAVSFGPSTCITPDTADSQFRSPLRMLSEDLTDEVFFDFSPKPERRVPPLPTRHDSEPDQSSEPEEDQRGAVRESASLPTVLESDKEQSIEAETEADRETPLKDASEDEPLVSALDQRRLTGGEDFPDIIPPKLPPPRATAGDALDGKTTETLAGMIPLGIGWRKKTVDERFKMPPVKAALDAVDGDAKIRRNKIQEQFMAAAFDNSDRREIGKGLVGRVLNRTYRSKRMESYVKKQIEEIEDHRPYFTYWVTTVQVVILIMSIAFYGFAPIGFSYTQKTGLVQQSNLVVETEGYMEPDNFWIGPRPADLIHLGAKFSPCMHRDAQVYEEIDHANVIENSTGCCIRTDQSGCVQTLESDCSARFASFSKWSEAKPEAGRVSGPVCGQDPRACRNPASIHPYEWKDDISKWPICVDRFEIPDLEHTKCEVTGRPCCISIFGKCEIVSRDYCDFVNGYYHEEATLCSQVDCLNEVCGLINFLKQDKPDQIYRIWLSLFLHAGIFHCILSVIMQLTILRDLEKLAGWHRICIIYIFSGIGGNLTSAIFIPYRAEVGPAGSQFGLLACLAVEVLQSWQMLKSPCKALLKLLAIICLLFALGLLPWIDNYAHIGGFICGAFLSFIFLPYICFGSFDQRRKRIQMVVSFFLVIGYFTMCFVLFYLKQFRNCSWCKYLNCVPLTADFCNDMDLILNPDIAHTS